jgi:hypothetical protein
MQIITESFILDKVELITQLSSVPHTEVQSIRNSGRKLLMVATSYHIYHHCNYGLSLSFFSPREQEKQMSLLKQNTAGIKSSLGLKLTPPSPFMLYC